MLELLIVKTTTWNAMVATVCQYLDEDQAAAVEAKALDLIFPLQNPTVSECWVALNLCLRAVLAA